MKVLRALVVGIFCVTGPLDAVIGVHFFIGRARKFGAEGTHFVPNFFGIVVVHGIAHGIGQETEDFPVRLAVRLRFNQFADALEAAVTRGVDGIVFAPGCGREDDVGVFAGLIEENVLYGDEGDGVEGPSDFRKVRIRLGRVFADDVVGVNLFFSGLVHGEPWPGRG